MLAKVKRMARVHRTTRQVLHLPLASQAYPIDGTTWPSDKEQVSVLSRASFF